MEKPIQKTKYAPKDKPLLVWDGECGFCRYWKTHWEKMAKGKLNFMKLQDASKVFPDIDERVFKKSLCLIEPMGTLHTGAGAVFQSFKMMGRYEFLSRWYHSSDLFRMLSESSYSFIADNRDRFSWITYRMFGKDPEKLKHYWLIYLLMLVAFLYLAVRFW